MAKLNEFLAGLPVDSRAAVRQVLFLLRDRASSDPAAAAALEILCRALERVKQRQASDRRTDSRRRKLVGVRVQIADYWKYRQAAFKQGISLYQWIYNALDAAAAAQGVVLDLAELCDLIIASGGGPNPKA